MNPKILNLYKKNYEQIKQEEADLIDYAAWLNGVYVMKAVGACLNSKNKYPETQLRFSGKQKEETGEIAAVKFGAFAQAFNKSRKKKGGAENG